MAKCDTCGNNYDGTFQIITTEGDRFTFDSFECAIHMLAPECEHCGMKVIGHGVQADDSIYCCGHCAREEGRSNLKDRAAAG